MPAREDQLRVAVVGGGPAAVGVLTGLQKWAPPETQVCVFDIGKEFPNLSPEQRELSPGAMEAVYARLRQDHGLAFPPPKSHFGHSLPKFAVDGRPRLWRSEQRGGLTSVWGGGMFPFTDVELASWPIGAGDLAPYYSLIADKVGICGEPDALNEYFKIDYVNRPPLRMSPVMRRLAHSVNANGSALHAPYRIVAGSSRLALETRAGHSRECFYCGECMLGCPKESVWSASQELDRFEADELITQYRRCTVRSFDSEHLLVEKDGREERVGPFDRIYVAAGCIGSSEITMRSFGLTAGPVMLDHAVLSFPIAYLGRNPGRQPDYFALCNLSMGGVPRNPDDEFVQFSIYPFFDHLWRYYAPRAIWKLLAPVGRLARWRGLLGRVYLGGQATQRYGLKLIDDRLVIESCDTPVLGENADRLLRSIRSAFNANGFHVPKLRLQRHATSSHYAGTFSYGNSVAPIAPSGHLRGRVFLADAATFPTSPAISPTFTIMANACRTARESLDAELT